MKLLNELLEKSKITETSGTEQKKLQFLVMEYEKQLTELKNSLEQRKNYGVNYISEINSLKDEMVKINNEKEKLQKENLEYENMLEELKTNLSNVSEEKSKIFTGNHDLSTKAKKQEEIINDLTLKVNVKENEIKSIQDELIEKIKEIDSQRIDLIATYEINLQILKERFKFDLIEMSNKLIKRE